MTIILLVAAIGFVLAMALTFAVSLALSPERRRRRQQRRRKRQYLRAGTAHLETPSSSAQPPNPL